MTVLFRPLPLPPARVLPAVCAHVRSEAPHHPLLDKPAHTRLAHASSASFIREAFDRSLGRRRPSPRLDQSEGWCVVWRPLVNFLS
ncbi:Orotidine 5'-phosphate decarboxylase [Clarias magur]|uniref:Orotidine 5'-phosphate decarboxylase n=1 Tax=Clarias magur TaxID=1594786 RepID=A0A8J4XES7_CLAMG|nr:Orotidine 5'-phosphate decarboxylase [Clarias magur]